MPNSSLIMELSFYSAILASFFILILSSICRIVNWVWWTPKKLERCLKQQGFRGTPYRLFVGDVKLQTALTKEANSNTKPIDVSDDYSPRVLSWVTKTVKLYGKDNYTWLSTTPRVVIMKPELLKEIFSRWEEFERIEPNNPFWKLLSTGFSAYNGQKWFKHRRIINPAFRFEKLKSMIPAMHLSCCEMINEWEAMLSSKDDGCCELDVFPFLQNLASDIISRTAFGSSYKEGIRIFQLLGEQTVNLVSLTPSVYIPGWRFLPTKSNKRIKEIDAEIQKLLRGMINRREKAMKAGDSPNDLLSILIESNLGEIREHGGNHKKGMSTEDVIKECKQFYVAGKETTSALLVWTVVLLAKYQHWQARARDETRQIFGSNNPDYDGLNDLKIVTMILYEVLRLYPPLIRLARTVPKTTTLGEITVPGGVQLNMPTVLIHRDPELWGDDAGEFKPERFSEGILKATNGRVCFFPFGWGPRICIGQNFALLQTKIALALILQRFEFELSPLYTHSPYPSVSLQPKHGAQLILRKVQLQE